MESVLYLEQRLQSASILNFRIKVPDIDSLHSFANICSVTEVIQGV